MKLKFLFLFLFIACNEPSDNRQSNFDRDIWLANNEMEDQNNPRAAMTEDLLSSYLTTGLTRDSIFSLLGEPYSEEITLRLKKGVVTPDSISPHKFVGQPKELQDKKLAEFNEWYQNNSQPDTLIIYPIGWSYIDPNFLVIKMNPDSIAYDFWIEQH